MSDVVTLSNQVIASNQAHIAALGDDAAVEDALAGYYAGLEALAATPATTPADLRAKAAALRTTFVGGCVEGDCGLAESLVEDMLRAA